MKRINKIIDLPKWFCLGNYDILSNLNDMDLINQLAMRIESVDNGFDWLDDYPGAREGFISYMEGEYDNAVRPLKGSLFTDKIKRKKYSEWQMDGAGGIEPLRLIDVVNLSKKAMQYIDENNIKRSLRGQKRSVSSTISNEGEMHINLDLSWPDEILLRDLATLLPIWRKVLRKEQTEYSKLTSSWSIIRKKIFDYKIIPMLDLIEWSGINKVAITNKVLALALFPNAEYDSVGIAQTIKPFIRNFSSDFSIEILKRKAMDNL